MGWTTDDNGTRRFKSESDPVWGLTIWAHCPRQIYVDSPGDTDVNVEPEGIQVFGETISVYDVSGVRFTIPWDVVREIIRFQDSVQSSSPK